MECNNRKQIDITLYEIFNRKESAFVYVKRIFHTEILGVHTFFVFCTFNQSKHPFLHIQIRTTGKTEILLKGEKKNWTIINF